MRPELETYHTIDRYLNNELQGDELLLFESKMAADPTFVKEVELMRLTNLVITNSSYDQLRAQMSADIQLRDHKVSVIKKSTIGGFALLAVGVAAYVYSTSRNVTDPVKNTETATLKPVVVESRNKNVTANPRIADFSKEKTTHPSPKEGLVKQEEKAEKAKQPEESSFIGSIAALSTPPMPLSVHSLHQTEAEEHVSENTHPKSVVQETLAPKSIQEKIEPFTKAEVKTNRFIIHPAFGETWKVPANQDKTYVLTIHNSAGQLVFLHKSLDSQLTDWEGAGTSGNVLEAGLYIYVIEYEDGSREAGNITIAK